MPGTKLDYTRAARCATTQSYAARTDRAAPESRSRVMAPIRRGLPGDIAVHERQDLALPLIHPEQPRSARPAVPLEVTKQPMDELGTIPKTSSHRVPDPDDTVDEATRQRNLNHAPSLDDRAAPPDVRRT